MTMKIYNLNIFLIKNIKIKYTVIVIKLTRKSIFLKIKFI